MHELYLFRRTSILAAVGILCLSLFFFDSACAQTFNPIRIPSRFSPVGSGARALGMGSAFIAIADDATAASWNPGGLIQLDRPEISVVGDYFYRTDDLHFGNNPEADHAPFELRPFHPHRSQSLLQPLSSLSPLFFLFCKPR